MTLMHLFSAECFTMNNLRNALLTSSLRPHEFNTGYYIQSIYCSLLFDSLRVKISSSSPQSVRILNMHSLNIITSNATPNVAFKGPRRTSVPLLYTKNRSRISHCRTATELGQKISNRNKPQNTASRSFLLILSPHKLLLFEEDAPHTDWDDRNSQ